MCRLSRPARSGRSTSGRLAWASSTSTGFVGGDANQWEPNLFRNNHPDLSRSQGKPGWNLDHRAWPTTPSTGPEPDQPDRTRASRSSVHYVPGGTHAPHHPTQEWVDKIHAMHLFDGGWKPVARNHLRQPEEAWA